MDKTQLTASKKIIQINIDWKANITDKDMKGIYKDMLKHAQAEDNIFTELPVYSCDAKQFYAGPAGIEQIIGNECAFDFFSTNEAWYQSQEEAEDGEASVNVVDFYLIDGTVYALLSDDSVVTHQEIIDNNEQYDFS